jgi:hypothetical protein
MLLPITLILMWVLVPEPVRHRWEWPGFTVAGTLIWMFELLCILAILFILMGAFHIGYTVDVN